MADDDKSVKTLSTLLNFVMIVVLIGYTYTLISSGEAELDFSFDTTQVSLTILAIMVSGAMLGHYSKKEKYGAFAANIGVMIVIMSMIAIFVTPRTQVLLPLGVLALVELGLWFWGRKKTEYGKRRDQEKTEAALAKDVDNKEARLIKGVTKTVNKLISSAMEIEEEIDKVIEFLEKNGDLRTRINSQMEHDEDIMSLLKQVKEHIEGDELPQHEELADLVGILKELKIGEEELEEHQEKLVLISMLAPLIQAMEKGEGREELVAAEHKIFRRVMRLQKKEKAEGGEEAEAVGYEIQLLHHVETAVVTTKNYLRTEKSTSNKWKRTKKDTEKGTKLIEEAGKLSGMITGLIGKYEEQLKLMNREIKKKGKLIRVERKEERKGARESPEAGEE
ncbi:TPA: hypothetical protein H1008_02505 [archaeon]|nr:hypothetical protein [Candidatus Undinarchaeales archaeon SRR5007147.bin71]